MKKVLTLCFAVTMALALSAHAGDQKGKKGKSATKTHTTKDKGTVKKDEPKYEEGDAKSALRWDAMVFDFGDVTYGADCSHAFIFKNVSDKPITINAVNTSCGCTRAGSTEEPVMSGKTGNVTARYNNNTIPGPFSKTITVSLDNAETIILTIKGTIKEQGK